MADDIRRCAGWLSQRKIGPGSRAVLHALNPYLYWVFFFALEAHGVISIGVRAEDGLDGKFVDFLRADLVISNQADPMLPGVKWVRADTGLVQMMRAFRPQPLPGRRRRPNDPICIVLSSGTTGTPKKVLLTRQLLDKRNMHNRDANFLDAGARLAAFLPHASMGGIYAALQTWLVGGTVIFPGQKFDWPAELGSGGINMLVGAPAHFEQLLRALPADMPRPEALRIICGGGTPSQDLRDRIAARLGDDIMVSYGSTEMSNVTLGRSEVVARFVEVAGPGLAWVRGESVGGEGPWEDRRWSPGSSRSPGRCSPGCASRSSAKTDRSCPRGRPEKYAWRARTWWTAISNRRPKPRVISVTGGSIRAISGTSTIMAIW
jgi:acyl-CoA synthetase (AMP-forming)/AMP-acid ligase II